MSKYVLLLFALIQPIVLLSVTKTEGLGANVRWKFIYGGLHLNAGSSISYLGIKAGVSF